MNPLQLSLPAMFSGVTVECRRVGRRLRVVPAGGEFAPWFVWFPRGLRVEGAQYSVEGLRPMSRGYYRPVGRIARVSP